MGILQKKLVIVILLACGIVTYSLYGFWPKAAKEPIAAAPAPTVESMPAANTAKSSEVVVYVSGGVNKPGVYKLAPNSRVVDAVNLAGGFAPGADSVRVNLAMHLKDEMQINVPYIINSGVNTGSNQGGAGNNHSDKININTASAAELDKLPGIGPALAERIIQYRTTNGSFNELTDIKKIPGIGEAKYNQFKDKISL